MTKIELLVGSDAFWARAAWDIASARRRLYVQAMSFEGDDAGKAVAGAIMASPARDRRVLVDAYSTVVISDRFVLSPAGLFDRALRAEAKATRAMFDDLVRAGARVRVTNPVGPLYLHYPARNHKKLIVADEVAYIGGINFSDHNFAWRDLMLRLEDDAAAQVLARDFEATFDGAPGPWREDLG
ncbi:MAG: phospholipase D-like domain-containing protein, partial [Pseudomonadota bacterium]